MRMRSRALSPIAIVLAISTQSALAFDCPEPIAAAKIGLSQKSAASVERQLKFLSRGRDKETMQRLLAAIRKDAPKADPKLVVSYVEAGYCPYVAKRGDLDELSKKQMVQEFSKDLIMMLNFN